MEKTIEVGYGNVKKVAIGGNNPLIFIGGPCAIEGRDHTFMMAEAIQTICQKVGVDWIFKACYDKDCRSAPDSFHGLGIDEGLKILSGLGTNSDTKQKRDEALPLGESMTPEAHPISFAVGG
jgi:2-dehydro-3-deoxyphosphooctonate aldolase (KDO 8-P synthase)